MTPSSYQPGTDFQSRKAGPGLGSRERRGGAGILMGWVTNSFYLHWVSESKRSIPTTPPTLA